MLFIYTTFIRFTTVNSIDVSITDALIETKLALIIYIVGSYYIGIKAVIKVC